MANDRPLADVKILDFMWAIAGPAATRVLADYGATVVRVESTRHFDTARTIGPYQKAHPGPEHSGLYQNFNAGKRGMTLDLTKPGGCAVALDLVRWADVVTESFSPNVMRAWGLDYESLREVKPDLIMLSTCLMGQTGPLSTFAGFGNLAAAISGFYHLAGWPDRAPAGPFGAYTDTVAPRFTAAAILAALDDRRRTGQGQYIDQSQAESTLHFLAPAILDYTVNGRVQERVGNRDAAMAPHGVYPAAGEDCWIAIAVGNDQQWQALCAVLERPDLLHDERFAMPEARLAHQDALDTIIAAWTRGREAGVAETALQMRGVPASALQNSRELCDDPQLAHRGHLVRLAHPILGTTIVEGSRFRLSRTPAKIDCAAPTLGGDNHYVLETILGYSEERIAELVIEGALE
jgi:crotonobetainyl-CoA:carnitine CoA-transferase CaiB-like acyl-CoA transferase